MRIPKKRRRVTKRQHEREFSSSARRIFNGAQPPKTSSKIGRTSGRQSLPEPEGALLTQELLDWADLILVMEPVHAYYVNAHFRSDPNKVKVLNIADRYFRDDPELIQQLKEKVTPILDGL
jgi:predicted protein tyrosine phosphatase